MMPGASGQGGLVRSAGGPRITTSLLSRTGIHEGPRFQREEVIEWAVGVAVQVGGRSVGRSAGCARASAIANNRRTHRARRAGGAGYPPARRAPFHIVRPPSTTITWPVIS